MKTSERALRMRRKDAKLKLSAANRSKDVSRIESVKREIDFVKALQTFNRQQHNTWSPAYQVIKRRRR